jgi:hypothetical protein
MGKWCQRKGDRNVNIQTQPKLINQPTEKQPAWSFEYKAGAWRAPWVRSKKKFQDIEEATRAAGLWMQISYDNNMPIAVRLVEVM